MRFTRRLRSWLFTRAGLLASSFLPERNDSGLFFFFPYYHVGGAEKVHADIVRCFSGERPWVFFTLRSENASFRPRFETGGRLVEIWRAAIRCPSFTSGLVAGFVNRHRRTATATPSCGPSRPGKSFPCHAIKGGGGTSFVPAFEWISRQDRTPDLLVYFTDAEGEFPKVEPSYPVLWLVKGKAKVPWGQRIQLN